MKAEEHVKTLLDKDRVDEAMEWLDNAIDLRPRDAQLYYLRGKLRWNLGDRKGALNDYGTSADLDPDGPATTALEHTRAIVDFFNPDLLNP